MAKKALNPVSVTRPQTDDEGSVDSDHGPQKSKTGRKQASVVQEADEAESMDEGESDAELDDEEEVGEDEDEEGEDDDEEMEDDDGMNGATEQSRGLTSNPGQKSFKSTEKPVGKSAGANGSVRKRLEMELAPAAVRRRIRQERFTPYTSQATGVFLASALETFMRELIDTAVGMAQERKGNKNGKVALAVQDIQKAVRVDEEFANIFQNVMFATHSVKAQEAVANFSKDKKKKIPATAKA